MIFKANPHSEVQMWSKSVYESGSWSMDRSCSSSLLQPFPWYKWLSMYWSASWSDDGLGCLSNSVHSHNWRKDIC